MQEKAKEPEIRFAGFTGAWEQRKLGALLDEYKVSIPTPHDGYTRLGIRSHAKGTFHEYVPKGRELETKEMNKVAKDKLILNITFAWEHAVAITDEKDEGALVSHRFPQFTLHPEIIPNFLKYVILDESFRHHLYLASPGGAGRNRVLKISQMLEYAIKYPSTAEQLRISNLLDSINSLITLHQRKYEKLLNIKKSMLEKMFPKEGEVVPEIRFKGFTGAWEQRSLGEICVPVQRNDPYSHAPVMMITASSGFIYQSVRYSFDNSGQSLQKYTLLKKGELAYNHGASKLRPFGSCFALNVKEARIPFVYHSFAVNDDDPEFVSLELNGTNVEKQLRKLVSSGARMDGLLNISFDDYGTVTLPLPSIDEQKKISSFFLKLDSLLTLHQRKLEMLKNVKQAFLEKMFV